MENTPKTLKRLLKTFIHALAEIYASGVESVFEIVRSCVTEFVGKYQEQCLYAVIDHVQSYMEVSPLHRKILTNSGPPSSCSTISCACPTPPCS